MKRRDLLSLLLLTPIACRTSEPQQAPEPRSPQATGSPPPAALKSVRIEGIPHVRQKPDFCGEAAVAMAMARLGQPHSQDDVFAASGMDPARGMGVTTRELHDALRHLGFDAGPVWHRVTPDGAEQQLQQLFSAIVADLHAGIPSIVCMHYDERPGTTEHFRLISGYDAERDEVLYHEPAEGDGAYRRMPRARLLKLWPLKYQAQRWTVVRLRLAPGELSAPRRFASYTPAQFAQHVMKLRRTLPAGFEVLIEPPFVVLGDGGRTAVKRSAEGTVRWAVSKLKRAYFKRDPKQILNVWLFKDARSYRHHTGELFGHKPDTPYGYYSPSAGGLIMNISTGGGTLVHEIVHPFMEANFPDCPAWINEGLGSLYEQSAERGGEIVGLTNWRLAGLQRALKRGPIPTFRELSATTDRAFYDEDPGTHYAQSRYLMYYLQEHGLVRRFYREALAGRRADPTGYQALLSVLGKPNMQRFERDWAQYVLKLRFRR